MVMTGNYRKGNQMRKRDRERFVRLANKLIESLGGRHLDRHDEWELETRFGRLLLHVVENRIEGPGTVFTRFDNAKAAHPHTGCNPHSGKWNHHFFDGWSVDAALTDLEYQLKKVLPVAVECSA
jgi:hypothetical protein